MLPPDYFAHALKETASQTSGPFVHIGLAPHLVGIGGVKPIGSNKLAGPGTKGERITIEGRIFDASGTPLRDALVEIWQANAAGRYNHPADRQKKPLDKSFRGWGRTCTDFETGLFTFETVKPGAVEGRNGGVMAPHVSLWIAARGINIGLQTRMYFPDEEKANAADPVLNGIEWVSRRKTLVAVLEQRKGKPVYRFDMRLQGADETVFFDA
ncbi:MAG TPA: protocatechuate 3,4-dioxygenase subunit alpha [Burkholderiales bacterium]|nr:protocatechuate 3,4-dioxygenase subunit alpha [Burkholderiales bacterium]